MAKNNFGKLLKELRHNEDIGIKKLAPELGLDYSYLSKLENDKSIPSEEVVRRVATYFDYDEDKLMLAANRLPPDIVEILTDHSDEAIKCLRERFGKRNNKQPS